MTFEQQPRPSWGDWCEAAQRLGLKRQGGELKGACPACGGTDRFHVRQGGGACALVGCRGCLDGQERGAGFGEVLNARIPITRAKIALPGNTWRSLTGTGGGKPAGKRCCKSASGSAAAMGSGCPCRRHSREGIPCQSMVFPSFRYRCLPA